jgi:integrase/recombinase XerD
MEQQWLPATTATGELAAQRTSETPAWVAQAGEAARFAFEEFFYGRIRNPHTRKAYLHALRAFSAWCMAQEIDLVQVTPGQVGRYLDSLAVAVPTRKLRLSALRRFFDELVVRHVLILNPALSVRAQRYVAVEGRTPEIGVEQARHLLKGLDVSHVVGLRDRAVIGTLIYTAARVGAVAKLRRSDFYEVAGQACLRFHEKGGKVREIPLRHDLLEFLQTYLDLSGVRDAEATSPLFRSSVRRTRRLTQNRMTADDMARMLKRRLREAGLSDRLSPHSLRVYVACRVMWRIGLFCGGDLRFRCLVRHITGSPHPRSGWGDPGVKALGP